MRIVSHHYFTISGSTDTYTYLLQLTQLLRIGQVHLPQIKPKTLGSSSKYSERKRERDKRKKRRERERGRERGEREGKRERDERERERRKQGKVKTENDKKRNTILKLLH